MEIKKMLSDGYDRTAGEYDAITGLQYVQGLWRLLPYATPPLSPAILDAGCGTGINLFEADRVLGPCSRMAGVDLSPGMVAMAREKAVAMGKAAEFLVADVEQLPFGDGSFDLVICNSVYHWFADRGRAISEMARVLRPGGQLLLGTMAAPAFQEWIAAVRAAYLHLFGPETTPWFPELPVEAELKGHLEGAGLAIQHLKPMTGAAVIQDRPGFVQLMATIAPNWLAAVPAGREAELVQEVTALLSQEPAGFTCTAAALEAVGVKR